MAINTKILFICPTGELDSGGEISNVQLIKLLKSRQYVIEVIVPRVGELSDTLREIGVNTTAIDYNWWSTPEDTILNSKNFAAIYHVYKRIASWKPSVVITNTLNIPWGAFAAALANSPHIWIDREFPLGEFSYLDGKMSFITDFSNTIMANSEQLQNYIQKNYEIKNVAHFYSFVDDSKLHLGKGGVETRLVNPSSINTRKNQIELIQALGILKKRDKHFKTKVLLIGSKSQECWRQIDELIKQYELENLVDWHDFTPTPWSLIGKNDILVQTSLSESIGRTTVEAMKLGIPVIASDIPGHQEALNLGGGTLYRSQDAVDLADKIQDTLANHNQLKKEAEATIIKKVLKNLSEDACSQPFIDAIESVVGDNNPQNELAVLTPYLVDYIEGKEKEMKQMVGEVERINKMKEDLLRTQGQLQKEIVNIRASKTYKLGRFQADIIKRIADFPGKIRK